MDLPEALKIIGSRVKKAWLIHAFFSDLFQVNAFKPGFAGRLDYAE
jgi:hypothetical protein